ncbi:DUF2147 domain-containing protein [Primorskyibacter sp. S187A]|uniref:DUF2147 domain-containing protein n=1 Tax=Primorskyibacter sp. S187A TaxID=3415130 RepID=UPI003C7C6E0F
MKTIVLAAALVFGAGAVAADPVFGTWKTQPGDDGAYGLVTIKACGSEICGTLGKGFDKSGKEVKSPNIGKRMIWAMKSNGGGKYSGGKIWAPDRDKTYNSRMTLSGNALKVQGCVLGICRGQTWTRVR